MVQKKITKEDPEFNLIQTWWKLRQEHYLPETDEDWDKLLKASDDFAEQYTGSLRMFARKLAIANIDDAEVRWKLREF